ncbi:MAG TPA: TonB-dependent receptor, partial [Bryobacteraceae bacterium]|nr:TonB-dependent receptor [Bryobacteraceae bacterium]
FPIIVMSDQTTWGAGAPNGSDNIVVEFRDDMSKVHGSHTFKWGYYYNNTHYNGFGLTYIAGQANFSQLNTAFPLDTSLNTGSSFASFLLGQASGYRLDTVRYVAGMYRTHQMYVQDDWRVTKRLTLNLGVRYEINLAPIYGQDMISNFDPSVANPAADGRPGALVFGGFGTGRQNSRTLAPDWFGGIGPRLGLSFALDSKTAIRVAATRSYGPVINPLGSTHYSGFVQQITNTNDPSLGLSPMFTLQGGAPYWAPVPNLNPGVANGTNVPYYNGATATRGSGEFTYAFNIQRQLGNDMVAEIGYLGVLASDIQSSLLAYDQIPYRNLPANLSPFTAAGRTLLTSQVGSAAANAAGIAAPFSSFNQLWGSGATVAQSLRPYPQYAAIDTIAGGGDRLGHSTYHSMEIKLSKRYSSGLTLQASYVLSKALTDSDNYSSTPTSMDAYNLALEKSIASFDQTHRVKLSYVYELPFGKGKKYLSAGGVASALLGGWRVAGIQTYVSGTPISVGTTVSFPIFNGANRATVPTYDGWRAPVKGDKFDPGADSFLQPVSFFGAQPTTGFGNETRYNPKLRNLPAFNENISLARSITLHEQMRVDFRWETFNLLNRTVFGPLSGANTLQNNNWGLWRTQANVQRRMQLSLKFYW